MKFDLELIDNFDRDEQCVVVNLGRSIQLSDGTILGSFDSGLFKSIEIDGKNLLVLEIGDKISVDDKLTDFCRKNWKHAHDIFKSNDLKDSDIYFSDIINKQGLEFRFIYFGENLLGRIHKEHDFFELHVQILGKGMMQKFHEKDENTLYETQYLSPGKIHRPFFNKDMIYPWHAYRSISKSIFLAIQSPKYMNQKK